MQSELRREREHLDSASGGRLAWIKRRFEWAMENRWPIATFHIMNVVYLFFLGKAYGQNTDAAIVIMMAVLYMLVFGFGQYLLVETPKQIRERVERAAKQEAG